MELVDTPSGPEHGDLNIYAPTLLSKFYESRGYKPTWSTDGRLNIPVYQMVDMISKSSEDGLDPSVYHLRQIQDLVELISSGSEKVSESLEENYLTDLDLLLSDAFFTLGSHLHSGRINPETLQPQWDISNGPLPIIDQLTKAMMDGNIETVYSQLVPKNAQYLALKHYLKTYRLIQDQGGWPALPDNASLTPGDRSRNIPLLRQRLQAEHYLDSRSVEDSLLFSQNLVNALRKFQENHGLEEDGIVDSQTLFQLNQPVAERIDQLIINMERFRWLNASTDTYYVDVNIADYRMSLFRDNTRVLSMRAIVGKPYRKTPVFSDEITYLVFNPIWYIPRSIAVKDFLPDIQKNPNYLKKHHIKVFLGWGSDETEIDPSTIEWDRLDANNFNYYLRQKPGPWNSLGRVKFMFPNRYNVYLHDTPARELFSRVQRTFSSGCIRLENAIDLAVYLLNSDAGWTRKQVMDAIDSGKEMTVDLSNPIPIHINYTTTWVNDHNELQFRYDIYGRDRRLWYALNQRYLFISK